MGPRWKGAIPPIVAVLVGAIVALALISAVRTYPHSVVTGNATAPPAPPPINPRTIRITQVNWTFTNPNVTYWQNLTIYVRPCEVNSTVSLGGSYPANATVFENVTVTIRYWIPTYGGAPSSVFCEMNATVGTPGFAFVSSNIPSLGGYGYYTAPIVVNISVLVSTPRAPFSGSLTVTVSDYLLNPPPL